VYIAPLQDRGELVYQELTSGESQELMHPEDRPLVRTAVERLLAGQTETLEVTHRARSATWPGGWIHVAVHGKVVERDADGMPRRVLGIFRNVTDEVEREAAARRRETAVANATRLASLGELASILGHELNQPLAALTTYVEAAARLVEVGGTGRRETARALRRCVDLAERVSEILKRVRRLVKRLPAVEESFDLGESAADAVALLEAEARDRVVEVRVRKPRSPVLVRCDRVQVEQALFNLCRNAIEAFADSPRRRRIVDVVVAARRSSAQVRIEDNGPGIPPEVAKELFEPFVSTKPEGSGLGLSISKSIAEAQGGSLALARSGPTGAGLVLRLPRERVRARGRKA
jgi:two-component system sensor histidine kinase DctS